MKKHIRSFLTFALSAVTVISSAALPAYADEDNLPVKEENVTETSDAPESFDGSVMLSEGESLQSEEISGTDTDSGTPEKEQAELSGGSADPGSADNTDPDFITEDPEYAPEQEDGADAESADPSDDSEYPEGGASAYDISDEIAESEEAERPETEKTAGPEKTAGTEEKGGRLMSSETKELTAYNVFLLGLKNYTYTGSEIRQNISVYYVNGDGSVSLLAEGVDYYLTYRNNINAGTAAFSVTGQGSYKNSLEFSFKINRRKITSAVLAYSDVTYTGKARTQTKKITVTADGAAPGLVSGRDFKVTYKNNVNIGTATAVIKGVGNYKGKITKYFNVLPRGTSIAGLAVGNGRIRVRWKKRTVNVSGYQICYSEYPDFSQAKTTSVKKSTTLKKDIKGLEPGKTYYFRIRVFFDWFGTRHYSKWSLVKEKTMSCNKMTISGSGGKRKIKVTNARPEYTNMRAAIWTVAGSQDDLQWVDLNRNADGSWETHVSIMNMNRSGECVVHLYSDNTFLQQQIFTIDADENFLGLYLKGEDSRIDFVQCAVNIARDDNIGYGHSWPYSISCSGLVGLSLTYCGYADFIQNDPLGWGYVGIGRAFESNLLNEMGCKKINGVYNSSNYKLLKAGDILVYDNEFGTHTGIYMGNGYTVEARGPEGDSREDDNGWEVAVYNWRTDVVQFDTVYRMPSGNMHYRW